MTFSCNGRDVSSPSHDNSLEFDKIKAKFVYEDLANLRGRKEFSLIDGAN
jgi:hypothetical protein